MRVPTVRLEKRVTLLLCKFLLPKLEPQKVKLSKGSFF